MTLTRKLDRAYDLGIIAFVSAEGLIIPVRARRDIFASGQIVYIRFADRWMRVRPELIRFVRQT